MNTINAIATIAYRDFSKLLRDRTRLLFSITFPAIFVGVLGNSLQSNIGDGLDYNFLTYTFTGVLAQVMFQTTASGVISLVEDRENDFAQEMFIAPVSRYSIVAGKIMGESMVASIQALVVVAFGALIGVPFGMQQLFQSIPAILLAALFGGAFGVLVLANLKDQRSANQLFPLLIFPQYFLAGVFNPIKELPAVLLVASRLAPLTYAVDLLRGLFYLGTPEYDSVVLNPLWVNLAVVIGLFVIFLSIGTWLFVRNEKRR